jgi:hypothetical protein
MASDIVDFVLQRIVERDILKSIQSWELLKDHLARECMMDPERLEAMRGEIVEKFVRCKREKLEKDFDDLMGTTSNKTAPASIDRVFIDQVMPESAGLEQLPDQSKGVGSRGEEEIGEPTFHPEIDEKLSVSGCLKSNFELKKYSSFLT